MAEAAPKEAKGAKGKAAAPKAAPAAKEPAEVMNVNDLRMWASQASNPDGPNLCTNCIVVQKKRALRSKSPRRPSGWAGTYPLARVPYFFDAAGHPD